jgi:hypothetical protein
MKIVVKNQYSIPHIEDILNQLKSNKIFSKIDLKLDYHQALIEKTNVCKTTLKSKEGLFEWSFMPFKLTNALTTFMHMMDDILRSFTKYFVVVYLDDILIFRKT